jgi:hypothetical protein
MVDKIIYGPDGQPIKRVDCTVEVNNVQVAGRHCTESYFDWNLPKHLSMFQSRMVAILKEFPRGIPYAEFLKEYHRRYGNG